MNYHTYNTPAFIISSLPAGESSRYIYIFTKDLGLVGAHAQNTRHVNSKLRYALDVPAMSQVSLVRGRNMWRLVSAVPEKRYISLFEDSPEKVKLCIQVFLLIKKLVAGEESNHTLFFTISSFLDFLENSSEQVDIKNIESIALLRILHILGYIPENELTIKFARHNDWSIDIVDSMTHWRKEAVKIINESLSATGL